MLSGQELTDKIDNAVECTHLEQQRNYIGASSIGNPCKRAIWYAYNGIKKKPLTAKKIRTFAIGKRLEELMKEQIRLIVKVIDDPINLSGNDDEIPLFQGTADCIIELDGKIHIVEIKTAKDKSFKLFLKLGLKDWSEVYYGQVQSYMGMKKISSAYIIVLNKDTSEIAAELIEFDEIYYEELKCKATLILESTEEPERINKNPMFYICAMCDYKEICHA